MFGRRVLPRRHQAKDLWTRVALSPETGILVRDGRERYRAEARRRWRQRREARPEPRGPGALGDGKQQEGPSGASEGSVLPQLYLGRGSGPEAEGEHVSAVAAFLSQSAGQRQNSRDKCPAGICCSSPGPSHTREAGAGEGVLPQKSALEAQVVKCQAGTQTRRPEPAVGPSWALAPAAMHGGSEGLGRKQRRGCGGWPGLFPTAAPRQSPWACSWSQSRASPAWDHPRPRGHCGTKGGPGGAADSGRPRTGQGQAQGCPGQAAAHLTGWQARRASKPSRGEEWPWLEWRPGHHPQGAGKPRLTPGRGPIAAGPTLRAGGGGAPARWRGRQREWTGSQQGPPSGLLSNSGVDLGAPGSPSAPNTAGHTHSRGRDSTGDRDTSLTSLDHRVHTWQRNSQA